MAKHNKIPISRIPGCTQMLFGHSSDVSSVAFHPSGLTFATCSEDKTVKLNHDMAGSSLKQMMLTLKYFIVQVFQLFFIIDFEGETLGRPRRPGALPVQATLSKFKVTSYSYFATSLGLATPWFSTSNIPAASQALECPCLAESFLHPVMTHPSTCQYLFFISHSFMFLNFHPIYRWDVTGTHVGSLGGHENRITQVTK